MSVLPIEKDYFCSKRSIMVTLIIIYQNIKYWTFILFHVRKTKQPETMQVNMVLNLLFRPIIIQPRNVVVLAHHFATGLLASIPCTQVSGLISLNDKSLLGEMVMQKRQRSSPQNHQALLTNNNINYLWKTNVKTGVLCFMLGKRNNPKRRR